MVIVSCLDVVAAVAAAHQIEVAEHEVGIKQHTLEGHCNAATSGEVSIRGITFSFLVKGGLLQARFEFVNKIRGINRTFGRICFPTRIGIIDRLRDKRHFAVSLHELHVRPCPNQFHLCKLLAHVAHVVLRSVRLAGGEIVVALVDDLVVGGAVEEDVFAVGLAVEIGNSRNRVAAIHGGVYKVATDFSKQKVLFCHVLQIAENTHVESHGVFTAEAFGITIHVGGQHVLAGGSSYTKSKEADKQTYN